MIGAWLAPLFALLTLFVLLAVLTVGPPLRPPAPAAVPAAEPGIGPPVAPSKPVPPSPEAAGRWWFDPAGPATPDDAAGKGAGSGVPVDESSPGLWTRALPSDPWQWTPMSPELITEQIFTGQGVPPAPAWPNDPSYVQAVRVRDPRGRLLGYWIWNAAFFVRLPTGSHQWYPRWQWAPAPEPLLLIPEVFPLDFGGDGPSV